MHRFYLPSIADDATSFALDEPDEFHHLVHVLRLKAGDRAEFTNGRGVLLSGEIVSIGGKRVDVVVRERCFVPAPVPRVTLACAIPKRAKFEDIIDHCTQLGVDEIIPMKTERTEVVFRGRDFDAKMARFEKVLVSAVKQSKRLWMPVLRQPVDFCDVIAGISPEVVVFIPWLEGERVSLKEAILGAAPKRGLLFLIGPEGDFTRAEVEMARAKGGVPVSLGANVLRVDTAAAAVVCAARTVLG